MVIAYHLILTGYGHWLPNDPRGSLSCEVRADALRKVAPIHFGRRTIQPSQPVLRAFMREAQPRLAFPILWFDPAKRQALGEAFAQVIGAKDYTCHACAILSNHAHLVIRKHRDRAEEMLGAFIGMSKSRLRAMDDIPAGHPIWSDDLYKKFLFSPDEVIRTIRYVEQNPVKSDLSPQQHDFIRPYRFEWFDRHCAGRGRGGSPPNGKPL